MTNDSLDAERKWRDDMVHRLRMQGWSRIDAESEAENRIETARQRKKDSTS